MQMSQISMILCNSTSLTELELPADEWMWKFYYKMLFFSLYYIYYINYIYIICLLKWWFRYKKGEMNITCDTKVVEICSLSVPEIVLRPVSAQTRWRALVLPNPPSSCCIDYIDQFAAGGWQVRMAIRLSFWLQKMTEMTPLSLYKSIKLKVFITISYRTCFDWERLQWSQ